MDEVDFIWMDGKIVKWSEAKVHVLTHTLHYGMGVFEGIRFYKTQNGSAVFRLKEHIFRMLDGAKICFMKVPYSEQQIISAIKEIIKVNKISEGYIRPIAYYGYGKMGLNPTGAPVNVAIAVWPWGAYLGDEAVKVKTSKFIRIHPETTHAHAKICGHYVNSIFASMEAKQAGFDESLLLDHQGFVAEGPGENFFIVKDNIIYTPELGNILPGITRDSVMHIANDLGISVKEKKIKLDDVFSSDEAFFTGTAAEITPIDSIDEKKFKGPGPITTKLREYFMDIVHGKNKKYDKWLEYV